MKLCGCGVTSLRHLFPFLIPIFSCMRMLFRVYLSQYPIISYPFVLCIIMLLGETLGGSLNCIVNSFNRLDKDTKLNKERRTKINKENLMMNALTSFDQIKIQVVKIRKWQQLPLYFIIFGLASIECVSTLIYFYILNSYENVDLQELAWVLVDLEFDMKSLQIIFTAALCSLVVFGYPLYRHQYLSILFIIVGIVIATVWSITKPNAWIVALFWLCYFLLWSIKEVIEKILMERYFFKPLFILFVEGLMGLCIILLIVAVCWLCNIDQIAGIIVKITLKNNLSDVELALSIGYLIGNIGLYICLIMTNKVFTPVARTVADSFSIILWSIIAEIIYPFLNKNISSRYRYIGYALIAIGCLVFNEVVILYFCGLEKNTRKEIVQREAFDFPEVEFIEVLD